MNSEKLHVREMGSAAIELSNVNGEWNITLDRVLYVPNLEGNLLSVARMEKKRMEIKFHGGKATAIDEDKNVIMTALRHGRLYQVERQQHHAKVSFGHVHRGVVKLLTKQEEEGRRAKSPPNRRSPSTTRRE